MIEEPIMLFFLIITTREINNNSHDRYNNIRNKMTEVKYLNIATFVERLMPNTNYYEKYD